MTASELKQRTNELAHRCVKLATSLPKGSVSEVCGRQLIRSATSVAANYRAVCLAQTKPTFVAKLSIVVEECDEVVFWIEFIKDEKLVKAEKVKTLLQEAVELSTIFITSRITVAKRKSSQTGPVQEPRIKYQRSKAGGKGGSSILQFYNSTILQSQ